MTSRLLAALGLLALLVSPGLATAQTPPDVVITREGGMFRGVIEESVPGDHVSITLASGETRVILWSQVRYAGPESERASAAEVSPAQASPFSGPPTDVAQAPPAQAPPAQAPPAQAPPAQQVPAPPRANAGIVQQGEGVELRVVSEQTRLALHSRVATASLHYTGSSAVRGEGNLFEELCLIPCTLRLPPGPHILGVSENQGAPLAADRVEITGAGVLDAHFVNNDGLRAGGYAMILIGGILGGVGMGFGVLGGPGALPIGFGIGVPIAAIGLVGGAIMTLQGDSAELRFTAGLPGSAAGALPLEGQAAGPQ